MSHDKINLSFDKSCCLTWCVNLLHDIVSMLATYPFYMWLVTKCDRRIRVWHQNYVLCHILNMAQTDIFFKTHSLWGYTATYIMSDESMMLYSYKTFWSFPQGRRQCPKITSAQYKVLNLCVRQQSRYGMFRFEVLCSMLLYLIGYNFYFIVGCSV